MKLLIITQYFYPENFRINELVAELVNAGNDVTVLTGIPNYPKGKVYQGYGFFKARKEEVFGAKVLRVPMLPRGKGKAIHLALNYASYALSATFYVLTRLRGQFDAIFVFEVSPVTVGFPAIMARWRFGAPILFWVLDLWPESVRAAGSIRNQFVLDFLDVMVRWIYARCDDVLVSSLAFRETIVSQGVPCERIHYFPNWVEAEYENTLHYTKGTSDRIFRIVYAGNIGVAQDFPAVLRAAKIVADKDPNIRWTIVGSGRMSSWVEAEVERLGIGACFEFLGQLPASEMPKVFSQADALLVSLKSDDIFALTVPGKVQSYLAAGRPLLAMLDGEGARIIKEAGGGLVVSAGDAVGLAQNVLLLSSMDAEGRQSIASLGFAYAKSEFGRTVVLARLNALLRQAIDRRIDPQQNEKS